MMSWELLHHFAALTLRIKVGQTLSRLENTRQVAATIDYTLNSDGFPHDAKKNRIVADSCHACLLTNIWANLIDQWVMLNGGKLFTNTLNEP